MNIKNCIQGLIIFIMLLSSSSKSAVFCVVHPSAYLQEAQWAKYFARSEEFSVLLPETPSLAFKSRPGKKISDRYEGRIYGAYGDGIVYVIISENNPKQAEKLDTFVGEFRKSLPRHQSKGSSELRFDREINLNNFPGKRYRVKFYNGIEGIVDFYMTNKHVYIVEVAGGDESNPSIQRFLKSFSLDENVLGKEEARPILPAITSSEPRTSQVDNQIFSSKKVTHPAFAISRPEPFYTEVARRNQVIGTVVLKAVLASSGKVTNIEVIRELEYGLTEKALEAASKLKFIPAVKDGKFVSQYVQIEYNFNLY